MSDRCQQSLTAKRDHHVSAHLIFLQHTILLADFFHLASVPVRIPVLNASVMNSPSRRPLTAAPVIASPSQFTSAAVGSGLMSPTGGPLPDSLRPAYMNVGLAQSKRQKIGWRHADQRPDTGKIKVAFSDLELGYIGEFIRNEQAAFAEQRAFRETVGDYQVKRYTLCS